MFSDVWYENAALFKRYMKIHPIYQYYMSSVESQKGVIAAQRFIYLCSIENQKGAIAVQSQWQKRPSGSQRNIVDMQ